jgi:hypothetical protein
MNPLYPADVPKLGTLLTRLVGPGSLGKTGILIPRNENVGVNGQGRPTSVLTFPGCSADPHVITATLFAQLDLNGPSPGEGLVNMGNCGPLVGFARWGSGDASQLYVEFDIPISVNSSVIAPGQMGGSYGAGAVVSIPASQLEVGVRNDASLTPRLNDFSLGDTSDSNVLAGAPSVTGSLGVGTRSPSTSLSRTIWGVNGGPGEVAVGLDPGDHIDIILPPFAQTFAVHRWESLEILVSQVNMFGTEVDGPFTIPASVPCPEMVLNNLTTFIRVTNNDDTTTLFKVSVVYGLSV